MAVLPSQLRHPERIHPALWRASQLARPGRATIATGFPELDEALPGRGWPVGQLIELMLARAGCGEMQLFRHAFRQQAPERRIALVHPPYPPCIQAWAHWQLAPERLLWLNTQSVSDTLWAAEQILRYNTCAAVLCWAHPVRTVNLRRLQLLARESDSLCVIIRPLAVWEQASMAGLRLALQPSPQGALLHIVKRQGTRCAAPITLPLRAPRAHPSHVPVDLPAMV